MTRRDDMMSPCIEDVSLGLFRAEPFFVDLVSFYSCSGVGVGGLSVFPNPSRMKGLVLPYQKPDALHGRLSVKTRPKFSYPNTAK